MREKPVAFLSYARETDIDDHITLLRKALEREVRLEIGEQFPIFQDRDDISWGDNWPKRIEHSIHAATFFIPVITPSFFRSIHCCSEVEQFRAREEALACDDLILPIKYVAVDDVQIPKEHAHVADILRSHQMEDWQDIRQYDLTHEVVRRKIASMARSIKRSYMKKLPLIRKYSGGTRGNSYGSTLSDATDSKPRDTPVVPRVVIFSHYSMPSDPTRWQVFKANPQYYVKTKWGEQLEAIDACPSVKFTFVFFSHAYAERLKCNPYLDRFRSEEVHMILRIKEYVRERRLSESRYVFIGYEELEGVLNEVEPLAQKSGVALKDVLMGGNDQLFYDAPKIVEALIRIARREIREPIIRVDEDVAVNEAALLDLSATYMAIGRPYFFFSGNYTWHKEETENGTIRDSNDPDDGLGVLDPMKRENPQENRGQATGAPFTHGLQRTDPREEHFLNDYSVRLHFLSVGQDNRSFWDVKNDIGRMTDMSQVQKAKEETRFYLHCGRVQEFLADLKILGYDVYDQPISGAGLCMSHTAIEQLPPFANLTRNITWIDDGIKRSLHEGIDDLDRHEDVRVVSSARFRQERLRGQKGLKFRDVEWALFKYLPRLFYGLLVSSLMYKNGSPGSYALDIKRYMQHREMPSTEAFRQWAAECKKTVERMHTLFTSEKYCTASGQALVDVCKKTLWVEKEGVEDSINIAIGETDVREADEKLQKLVTGSDDEIAKEVGFDAGVLIGQTILEMRRYFELLEFWPYLTRTVVFMMRSKGPLFHLLGRNPEPAARMESPSH